jgi:hypothetical protein
MGGKNKGDLHSGKCLHIVLNTGFFTAKDFIHALCWAGCKVDPAAEELLSRMSFPLRKNDEEVTLVVTSVAGLGFLKSAKLEEILRESKSEPLNFLPCSIETALQLGIEYTEQPMDKTLFVAMEPIVGSDGAQIILCITHDEGDTRLLIAHKCITWSPDDLFVFLARK